MSASQVDKTEQVHQLMNNRDGGPVVPLRLVGYIIFVFYQVWFGDASERDFYNTQVSQLQVRFVNIFTAVVKDHAYAN